MHDFTTHFFLLFLGANKAEVFKIKYYIFYSHDIVIQKPDYDEGDL